MSLFTSIGVHLWQWEPLRALVHGQDDTTGRLAQLLWMQLYTIPEAKSGVPGLMIASVNTIAEATCTPPDLVRALLDRLLEHEMIEFDPKLRVLRMTELPDDHEFPTNANGIRSWWRRFQNIPASPLRDAHIHVLRGLMDTYARRAKGGLKACFTEAWEETFATIAVPVMKRRKRKHQQQELALNPLPEASSAAGSYNEVAGSLNTYPQPSPPISEKTKINDSDNSCLTAVKQDPDQVSSSSLSGSGGVAGEGCDTGNASSSKPHLAIVPEGTPFGPEVMLRTLERDSRGKFVLTWVDDGLWPALRDVVAQLCAHGVTLGDLALVSAWLARGLAVEGREARPFLGPWWAAKPNCVLYAVQRARIAEADEATRCAEADRRSAELRKQLSEGPYNLQLT